MRFQIELLSLVIQILATNQQILGKDEPIAMSKSQPKITVFTQLHPTTMTSLEVSFTGFLHSSIFLGPTDLPQTISPTSLARAISSSEGTKSTSGTTDSSTKTKSKPPIIKSIFTTDTQSVTIKSILHSPASLSQKVIQSSLIILPTQKSKISQVWLTSTSGGVTILVIIGLLSLIIILLLIVLLNRKSDQGKRPRKFGYGPDLDLEEEIGQVNLRELSNADVDNDDLPPPLTDGDLENIEEPVPTSTQLNNSSTIAQKDNEHLI